MVAFPSRDFHNFSSKEVQQLLHNKFVVILGDSIHRTIYKDLVRFLQDDGLLTDEEAKMKGKPSFWHDHRVEGGHQHQKTNYREVRQYRTDHHLVRTYFITRIYSDYMESILDDFRAGPSPDLVILNSCIWDLNRYLDQSSKEHRLKKAFREYRQRLRTLFEKLLNVLPPSCLIIWDTALPIAREIMTTGMNKATPVDILRANFDSASLACCYKLDILDLNFRFRFLEHYRAGDGLHWNNWVHRRITNLLLTHVADAWGVKLVKKSPCNGITWNGNAADWHGSPQYHPRPPLPWRPPPQPTFPNCQPMIQFNFSRDLNFQHDTIPDMGLSSGFFNFEDDHEPPVCQEEVQYGNFHGPLDAMPNGALRFPPSPVELMPNDRWGHPPLPVDDVPNGELGPPTFLPVEFGPNEGWRGLPLPVDDMPDRGLGFLPPIPDEFVPTGGWGHPPSPFGDVPNGGWGDNPPLPVDDVPNGELGPLTSLPIEFGPNEGWRGHLLPVDDMPDRGLGFLPPIPDEFVPNGGWGHPPSPVDGMPNGAWRGHPPQRHRSPRGFWGRRRNSRVMHQRRFYTEHYRPYF